MSPTATTRSEKMFFAYRPPTIPQHVIMNVNYSCRRKVSKTWRIGWVAWRPFRGATLKLWRWVVGQSQLRQNSDAFLFFVSNLTELKRRNPNESPPWSRCKLRHWLAAMTILHPSHQKLNENTTSDRDRLPANRRSLKVEKRLRISSSPQRRRWTQIKTAPTRKPTHRNKSRGNILWRISLRRCKTHRTQTRHTITSPNAVHCLSARRWVNQTTSIDVGQVFQSLFFSRKKTFMCLWSLRNARKSSKRKASASLAFIEYPATQPQSQTLTNWLTGTDWMSKRWATRSGTTSTLCQVCWSFSSEACRSLFCRMNFTAASSRPTSFLIKFKGSTSWKHCWESFHSTTTRRSNIS